MGQTVPIPITKGVYKNVDSSEVVGTPEYASELKNIVIGDSGANKDRPAVAAFASTGDNYGITGLYYFRGANAVIAVDALRQIWRISQAGSASNITGNNLDGSARPVFADDGTYVAIAGGGTPQQWSGSGATTDLVGSPPACTHINYLDGYWLTHLINDQEFRWAGPTETLRQTFNTANFFQAEGLPDTIVAQTVLLRELYAFGPDSTEIFQNFGSSSVPFQRTFFIDRGCGAAYSVVRFDNTLAWLDNERRIVRMNGRTPEQISVPIDRVLQGYSRVSDCWAANIQIAGFYFLLFVFPAANTAWAYDYKRGEWYEWDGYENALSTDPPFHSALYVKEWNKTLVGDPDTGSIYQLSFDAKADGSGILRRLRRMRYKHGTGARKRSNYYLFHLKRGVGIPGSTEPVVEIRVNDDNKGWSASKQVGLGFPGSPQAPLRVRMGGIYRERQLEIQMTDAAEFSLTAIEENVDLLDS